MHWHDIFLSENQVNFLLVSGQSKDWKLIFMAFIILKGTVPVTEQNHRNFRYSMLKFLTLIKTVFDWKQGLIISWTETTR